MLGTRPAVRQSFAQQILEVVQAVPAILAPFPVLPFLQQHACPHLIKSSFCSAHHARGGALLAFKG